MLRRSVFALALAVVLTALLLPSSDVPSGNDKVEHASIFAALTLIGLWARFEPVRLLVLLSSYAVITEVLQATLTSTRQGDPRDVLADVVGIVLVLAGFVLLGGVRRVRPASSDRRRARG